MAARIVVGLFESRGTAEDACNRLRTEGVPHSEIALHMLKEISPTPSTMRAELAALSVDPLVLGNVRDTYAPYIRNGETVVLVRAANDADVEFATDTLRQYAPVKVETLA